MEQGMNGSSRMKIMDKNMAFQKAKTSIKKDVMTAMRPSPVKEEESYYSSNNPSPTQREKTGALVKYPSNTSNTISPNKSEEFNLIYQNSSSKFFCKYFY